MDAAETRFAVTTGASALAFFVLVFVIYPAPISVIFLGVVLGSLVAMVAMGLVLVYRANRIVNFAQGALGAVAATLAASIGWPFIPAVIAGLIAALGLGAVVEIAFIRRFANAPRLVLTVATLGIAQLLDALGLLVPRFFDIDDIPDPPQPPFNFTFEWHPIVFQSGHLLIVVVVPLIALGLSLFLRRSRFGIAMRAAAESTDRAALLGIPVKRINTMVWVIAAGMAAVGTLLRLPIQGIPIGSVAPPRLIVAALAAAVIGRMENLPVTFGAAVAIGTIQQVVLFETGTQVVSDAVVFGVILIALLMQRSGADRSRSTGVSSWTALRLVRPIPRELRRLPEIRYGLAGLAVIAALALIFVPLTWNPSRVNLFSIGVASAVVFCSLLIVTGFGGQISLGHLAFVAAGAATAGSMSQNGTEFFTTILVAGLVGAGVAIAIGVPALRMEGPFFAVTSLAFAIAMGTFFLNPQYFGWFRPADNVRILRPVIFDKFDLESEYSYYYFVLFIFLMAAAVVWRTRASRTGRAIVANKENTRAAQGYSINSTRAQLTAFGLSGFMAGVAGALYVYHGHGLQDSLVGASNSILVFAIAIVGGLGSLTGAMLGAAYFTFISFSPFTRTELSQLFVSGVGVLAILLFFPGGISDMFYRGRDWLLRRLAAARGIHVPSLVADQRIVDEDDELAALEVVPQARNLSEPSDDPLLITRGVEVSYGKTQVLFGVDFHVERGEIVALLGTNGAGKSTLLSAIAGLVPPTAGSIHYDGEEITGDAPGPTVRSGVVFMPGGKGVFPTLTVAENLKLAAWMYEDDPERVTSSIQQVLEHFPVLRDRWDQRAGNLSGGEQQMLVLGQALILQPRLLMIDELSLGLAPVIVERLLGIVRKIHERGTTIVLVEQSVNIAITLAQRAVFLEKGEVRFDGPTADLLERPDVLRSVFLEGAGAADGRGVSNGSLGTDGTPLPAATKKQPFEVVCAHCGHEHGLALEVQELSISFGGIRAVQDVSFDLHQGEILGIIGPNGAGKTTVFDLISGFLEPSVGQIVLQGEDVTGLTPDMRAAAGLGRSFQDARLFPGMTVRQTIATALERHIDVRDPISPMVLSPAIGASEKVVDEKVDELIELMRLGAYADKFVGELSTGTRRIVDLSCTLAHQPSVLLLDEPSSGIAQRETEALGPVLLNIKEQTGAALVVIEHDMPLITGISDDLIALELGQVVKRGTPEEVITDPRVVEGYLGGTQEVIKRSGTGVTPSGDGPASTSARSARRTPLKAAR